MDKSLCCPVRYLKGIGPKRAEELARLGINTLEDLLYFFPRRYEDRCHLKTIAELTDDGSVQTTKGRILTKKFRRSIKRRNFSILEVVVADDTGKLVCVWFNQPFLKDYFQPGDLVVVSGKLERYGSRLQLVSPEFEIIEEGEDMSFVAGRIVPIYSLPQSFTQRTMRQIIKSAIDVYLPYVQDFLPYDLRQRHSLLNLAKALLNIHFPESLQLQKEAYRRLCFEEFFLFQLPLLLRKLSKKEKKGIAHKVEGRLLQQFIQGLPFELTFSQKKVIEEILYDMSRPTPMQRLLQGDVGSGKTVVATVAAIVAIQGGWQVAFMVPTEILARQHFEKVSSWVKGVSGKNEINIALLTGSTTAKEKELLLKKISGGSIDIIVGTHALLEGAVKFSRLGLVIIDEQHKFGVGQRALLPAKGLNPDVLIMTATPIPRTLAITLYGDLDVSVISELPPGRKPVTTIWLNTSCRAEAYKIASEQLGMGHQVYIIYPVIEESFLRDIEGAKKMYQLLKDREFRGYKVGLIHGQLPQRQQDDLMQDFRNNKLDILVSTTVLEVGIDVPNATCMIIEYAERFGLAQLHQLRGRIGRGAADSFCVLVSDAQNPQAKMRLEAMTNYSDGFQISEVDLKIRGPGEFFGQRQHGLSELKIGNPLTQMQLLKLARDEAKRLLEKDRYLSDKGHTLIAQKLIQRFPEYEKMLSAG